MTDTFENSVSVILPTFRRPDGLEMALNSLLGQTAGDLPIELVVVDNDPDCTAKEAVDAFAREAPFPVTFVHEPNPGVSNARNAALEAAKGRYLAFLDDDQSADAGWLEGLLESMRSTGAVLAFGPTVAVIPSPGRDEKYMADFFSRQPELADGLTDEVFGCGNSLLDRGQIELPTPPFELASNELGGEDDVLFAYLLERGGKVVWTNKVGAKEYIRPHRATHRYVWIRSFAFGQGHALYAWEANPRNWFGIIKWMGVGVVQSMLYGAISLGLLIIRHPAFIKWSAKFCDAVGKIFWLRSLHPKLYGAAMAKRKGIQ